MQDTELRFHSLKDLIDFKQLLAATELRIDTNEKSLTGRFSVTEIETAVTDFKALMFPN